MNKYNKYMDKIEVTDEMRERILKNLGNVDLQPKKQSVFIRYRAWFAAAACLAVVAVGAVTVARLSGQNIVSPSQGEASGTYEGDGLMGWLDMTECGSVEELSAAVGFEVSVPEELPFSFNSTEYLARGDSMAEITWSCGGERAACFRQQKASGDISGDFTSYQDEITLQIGGIDITAKGDGGIIHLAYWNVGEMAYSLNVEDGISEQQLTDFVSAVVN